VSNKRRKDSDHDIGDSSPGTVGDKETDHSKDTPMDRIHRRRNGDVSVPAPTNGNEPNDEHSDKDGADAYDEWGIPTGITHPDDDESE
jgi:hypothetical protein